MRRDACNLIHIVSFDVNSLSTLEAPDMYLYLALLTGQSLRNEIEIELLLCL